MHHEQTHPDKAEVALEYPDKLYIGTFERSARFDAHLDETGISLRLERPGDAESRRSIRMHVHYALFAEILNDLARTVSAMPPDDVTHRTTLRDAARALHRALGAVPKASRRSTPSPRHDRPRHDETDISSMSPKDEVALLHVLE
jgi:hypothetical protein